MCCVGTKPQAQQPARDIGGPANNPARGPEAQRGPEASRGGRANPQFTAQRNADTMERTGQSHKGHKAHKHHKKHKHHKAQKPQDATIAAAAKQKFQAALEKLKKMFPTPAQPPVNATPVTPPTAKPAPVTMVA